MGLKKIFPAVDSSGWQRAPTIIGNIGNVFVAWNPVENKARANETPKFMANMKPNV